MISIYVSARPVSRLEWEYFFGEGNGSEDQEEGEAEEEKKSQAFTPAESFSCLIGFLFPNPMLNFLDEMWDMFQKHVSLFRTLSTIFTT
jgi:hypothetical protein